MKLKREFLIKLLILNAIVFIIALNSFIALDCDGKVVRGAFWLECIQDADH